MVSEQLACTELSEEEEELERVEGVFFLAILLAFKLIRMESRWLCFQFLPDSKMLHIDILIDCLLPNLIILKQMKEYLKHVVYSLF